MRILLASDFYPPVPGGLEAHVQRLAHHLADRGHQVSVVTTSPRPSSYHDGPIQVTTATSSLARVPLLHQQADRAFPPPWPDRSLVNAIEAEARRGQAELIHVHGWLEASAARVATKLGVPLVVTLHDWGLLCPTQTLLRDGKTCPHRAGMQCLSCPGASQGPLKRLGLGLTLAAQSHRPHDSRTYIAVSNAIADRHRSNGVPIHQVIPNFLDYPADPVTQLPDTPTVLFVGPESPHKGLHLVEQAFESVRSRRIPASMIHVGGTLRRETDGSIRRVGVLPPEAVQKMYREATVVAIAPTWEEPCPTVALEAMAAGRPVVASAIGGLLDIVDPGTTGLLVTPRSADALADGLAELLQDPGRAAQMGQAGRERLRLFSSDEVVSRIEDLYLELCGVPVA
jgi:glycosyltransferase involved in cell wall biosynthesis